MTVYPVMTEPPSLGAVQDTIAWAFPALALTAVGAAGAVAVELTPPKMLLAPSVTAAAAV